MQAMPCERTAVTAGDHIDWITTSPEAIRLTRLVEVFQKARNWPAFLASIRIVDGLVDLVLGHVALVGVLVRRRVASTTIAASMMPIEGMLRIAVLPLNSGFEQVLPVRRSAADQVGPDAERVGVVDGRDAAQELGRLRGEGLGIIGFEIQHLVRQGALCRDLASVGVLALGEDRYRLIPPLVFVQRDRLHDVAANHIVLSKEFGVGDVDGFRLVDQTVDQGVMVDGLHLHLEAEILGGLLADVDDRRVGPADLDQLTSLMFCAQTVGNPFM